LRVGVVGAGGRMGREVCRAVGADRELELVSAVDPGFEGLAVRDLIGEGGETLRVSASVEDLGSCGAEVAVDFTSAEIALGTMRWCAANAVHAVVGTSGLSREALAEIEGLFSMSPANCVVAPNFAIGAVLMMRLAELAAPYMDAAEIVELHHDRKLDAPSGTAIASAARMSQARRAAGVEEWAAHRTVSEPLKGARGAEGDGGVHVHSVRLPGLVAHQEIILGAAGQTLSIRHDAYDRTSFMPGVVLAVKAVPRLEGLTVGLDALLGLK
jgi:4-hydroxy-tetrahydrodipicolinate reductase